MGSFEGALEFPCHHLAINAHPLVVGRLRTYVKGEVVEGIRTNPHLEVLCQVEF